MSFPKCEMSSHFELEDTGESFVEKRDYKNSTKHEFGLLFRIYIILFNACTTFQRFGVIVCECVCFFKVINNLTYSIRMISDQDVMLKTG